MHNCPKCKNKIKQMSGNWGPRDPLYSYRSYICKNCGILFIEKVAIDTTEIVEVTSKNFRRERQASLNEFENEETGEEGDFFPHKLKEEHMGEYLSKNPYTKSQGRRWTDEEIKYMDSLIEGGYDNAEIGYLLNRTPVSIQIKRKRLQKTRGGYNAKHLLEKIEINKKFLKFINPRNVLDVYCGNNELYDEYDVTKNDINKEIVADYHMDSHKLLCKLYSENKKYDLIDLDPYGSAYDCFDLAIKMANKGLCITLGEMGAKRWKRLDFVERYYGITSLDDFNSDMLINHIINIGARNKKKLEIFCKRDWHQISRVWFTISHMKITSQWAKNN